MKTKNFILLFSFVILSISLQAQNQKPSFGITAGATFASYKATIADISLTSKTKTGFTAGIISSFGLGKSFSFQPGLNFTQKGGIVKSEGTTDNLTLDYLELPLDFVYNAHSSMGNFFIGAGPSLSFGLSGQDKYEDATGTDPSDIKFGSGTDDDFKSFEAGLNLLTGYQFKGGFLISANYNLGLSDISNDDQAKYHNNYLGIRLGYMFPGKRK